MKDEKRNGEETVKEKEQAAEADGGRVSREMKEKAGEEELRSRLDRLTKRELEEEIIRLTGELEKARRESREYLEDLQRLKAEFDNYRKRMVREQTRIIEQASRSLVEKLLPVIDNLEKALEAAGAEEGGLADGVRMVYEQLMDTLEREGLEVIDPHGRRFDPNVCEAMMTVLSDDHEDETVVEVHQKGYRFKGDLLRPARATVSKCGKRES
jgi:molecular chaperone GrpE